MTIGTPPIVKGPIAPESNPPINPNNFKPSLFFISALTLGTFTTTVTTTMPLNYVINQQIRLLIPSKNGSLELNGQTGYVLSIPAANQVIVSIPSSYATAFVTSTARQQPQIIAIGDNSTGAINLTNKQNLTFIPGAFINISPQPLPT
jgi:hypothetical protein